MKARLGDGFLCHVSLDDDGAGRACDVLVVGKVGKRSGMLPRAAEVDGPIALNVELPR